MDPASIMASPREPSTAPQLLRLLRVHHEPVARQWPAVAAWLAQHTPTSSLTCSLRANGYGFLLNQVAKPARRRGPITSAAPTSTCNRP